MPRKVLQRNNALPYHVTARTNNREDFPVALEQLWKFIGIECLFLNVIYGVQIQVLLLMPNHLHMILTVPEFDLGIVMNEFMRSASRYSNSVTGRTGHLFGGPYHWSLIKSSRYFGHALKYVYRNPVKAKICERVEEYPFSTLHGLLGYEHLAFPIFYTSVGLEKALPAVEARLQLDWLNKNFSSESEALIQKGLRRKVFDVVLDRGRRKLNNSLMELI
jgi:putative transposase